MKIFLLIVFLVLIAPSAYGGMFKCIGPNGHVSYQQAPCPSKGEEIEVHDNQVGGGVRQSEVDWYNALQDEKAQNKSIQEMRATKRKAHDLKAKEELAQKQQACVDAKTKRQNQNDLAGAMSTPNMQNYYRKKAQDTDDWIRHNCRNRN